MISLFLLLRVSFSKTTLATGFVDKSGHVRVEIGSINRSGSCWANYTNSLYDDGWYKYVVEGREGEDPYLMSKCAGYLEGFLAQKQILDAYNLYLDATFDNRSNELPSDFEEWMQANMDYAFQFVEEDHKFSKQYKVFTEMFQGLFEGYNAKADDNEKINKLGLWIYSSNGDITDILPLLGHWEVGDHRRARCTALIKLLPDFSDIFMSHNTWCDYRQLHAVLKEITLPIPFFNAHKVLLSTRIGMIGSVDDFYVSDSNLMVFETSLLNQNMTLAREFVKKEAINYWIRANTAMFVADGGKSWVDIFMYDNSGTYNNDYYIIDINKFKPGIEPTKDLVWLVEQTPSNKLFAFDVTQKLVENDHIESFNVPVTQEIYDMMDYKSRADFDVLFIPFFKHPRYLISERVLSQVETFDDFLHAGRYNKYLTDTESKGNPLSTIASRNELNTSAENDDFWEGALDNKACRASEVFTRLNVWAINSPTNEDSSCPTFNLSYDRLGNYPHDGLPEIWDFKYIQMSTGTVDRCGDNEKEKYCVNTKFCGWCGETSKCMPGNAEGSLFGEKCPSGWETLKEYNEKLDMIIAGAVIATVLIIAAILTTFFCLRWRKSLKAKNSIADSLITED